MKTRVLFFIESLSGGGAEKVLITMLSHLDYERYDVEVLTVSDVGLHKKKLEKIMCQNSPHLTYRTICGEGKSNWQRMLYRFIYHYLPAWIVCALFIPSGYDTYVAFVEGFCTKVLSCLKERKVAWVHCDLKNQPWPIQKRIYKNKHEETDAYRKYNKVVCVSQLTEKVMREFYGLSNTMTIYNPISREEIIRLASIKSDLNVDSSRFNIISVGRLEEIKGYDELIPIIRDVETIGVDVHLWLVGEGTQTDALKKLVTKNKMDNLITFTGFLRNPYSLMTQMDLFVCSSRAEGFSLVVAEALILGIPVVSMRCLGPEELLGYGKYGILCDDYEQLKEKIAQLVTDKNKYEELKHMAEGGGAMFNIEQTMSQVYEVL